MYVVLLCFYVDKISLFKVIKLFPLNKSLQWQIIEIMNDDDAVTNCKIKFVEKSLYNGFVYDYSYQHTHYNYHCYFKQTCTHGYAYILTWGSFKESYTINSALHSTIPIIHNHNRFHFYLSSSKLFTYEFFFFFF